MGSVSDELLAHAAANLGASDVRRLNDGGQKAVARATGPSGDCILKVVLVDAAAGDHALQRARRETQILGEIDSPHVVKLQSAMLELGTPVTAVAWLEEYLDGRDLIENLGVPWTWDGVKTLISQVCVGLQEFHGRRVAHRDLSPKNLRQTSDGRWVIIDPGIARFMDLPPLTQFGAHPGTPGFMSPEHVSHVTGPIEASDVFVVGVLAYLCLTGQLPVPFTGDIGLYVAALQSARVPTVAALRPDLDGAAVALIDRMLHPHPARRFIDAAELLAAT